jgi:hypothetical protein
MRIGIDTQALSFSDTADGWEMVIKWWDIFLYIFINFAKPNAGSSSADFISGIFNFIECTVFFSGDWGETDEILFEEFRFFLDLGGVLGEGGQFGGDVRLFFFCLGLQDNL